MAATIKDVAKATGLSIATISKYLNGGNVLGRNRVLIEQAIKELNFRVNTVARGLKTQRTMTIGVLIPDLKNLFSTSIVSHIENILIQHGYSTIICDYQGDPALAKERLDFLVDKMVDGIIMLPLGDCAAAIETVIARGISVVLLDRFIKAVKCDMVLVDNLNAAYAAVEQLIIKGHRRIGIICGPESIYTTQERLKGYLRVHEDYAIPVKADLIKFGDYQMQSGYDLLGELLATAPPPTAVFVTNYEMTLGAIMRINERNVKIPQELSFIGFDNLQMAQIVKPPLSIVQQPMQAISETAANILLKRLRGDMSNFPQMFRLKAQVLLKESISAIPG